MSRFAVVLTSAALAGGVAAPMSTCAQPAPVAAPGVASSLADYRLGVSDKVRVIVFNEPTLSGEFTVNSDGKISAPLAGEVVAAGRTVPELRDDLTTRFAAGYLKNPSVSVEVLTFRPFYILGEVNKPGEYPYATGLTVLNGVAVAGGFTYRANQKRAYVKADGETSQHVVPLSPGLLIHPGDTVRIGERFF